MVDFLEQLQPKVGNNPHVLAGLGTAYIAHVLPDPGLMVIKRVAVFGARGMLGRAMVEELEARGFEVLAFTPGRAISRTSDPSGPPSMAT